MYRERQKVIPEEKKVKNPYNAADARHVDFLKFGRRGAPVWWWALVVSDGVSELLQTVYTKP